jgi:hypothetical protein
MASIQSTRRVVGTLLRAAAVFSDSLACFCLALTFAPDTVGDTEDYCESRASNLGLLPRG